MGYSARRGFTSGSMKQTGAARQAEMQQKIAQMQEQMNATQEAVEAQEFTASVGGGVVEAKVNGKKELLSIQIKPEAVDPEDVEMLQDLVAAPGGRRHGAGHEPGHQRAESGYVRPVMCL